jgi:hypothetical protein
MKRSAQTGENWSTRSRAAALLISGFLAAASPAYGQTSEGLGSPEMAAQKAQMLEMFFSSYRLREALGANPEAVAPLEAEAGAKLAEGKAALTEGRVAEAIALFDAGMRAVSRAIATTSEKSEWDAQAAAAAFVERRRHADAYLAVVERAEEISDVNQAQVASLRADMERADQLFSNKEIKAASKALERTYGRIVDLVSEVQRGRTLMVSRVFETAQEEYEYELGRNDSYDLLLQIALAEKGDDQPGFAALSARLTAESEKLREQAEQQAAAGDYPDAISLMESATERLLVALRASGLIVME